MAWVCVVVAEGQSHKDLSPLFWRGILFIRGGFHYRCQVKSDPKGLYWLLYVFTLTEINNSHNIVGRLLMSWLTSMFSSVTLTYKNSKIGCFKLGFLRLWKTPLPLLLPAWTLWRLVCQNISCPTFWYKKTKYISITLQLQNCPFSVYKGKGKKKTKKWVNIHV